MKKKTTCLIIGNIIAIALLLSAWAASAQTVVNRYACIGSPFTISVNDTVSHTWYKNNVMQLSSPKYTETPTATGTFSYQVISFSATGCTSPISDVFTVQVLPAIAATITSPLTTVCAAASNSVLLTATAAAGFTYNYQWFLNGTIIPGATNQTYNVSQATVGIDTFSCVVSYTLLPGCSASATKVITVINAPTKPAIQ